MTAISAAAPNTIQSPSDLTKFIQFENHKPFPIDTATEWRIHPICVESQWGKKQIYQVEVGLNTLKGGQPYGWIDYHFQADTVEKANALIKALCNNNVKWNGYLTGVTPLLDRKAIRLTFGEGWAGGLVQENDSIKEMHFRDVFEVFHSAAGVNSPDYQIASVVDDANSVDLVFDKDIALEVATVKMKETLAKLQKLFANNAVFQCLASQADQSFQVQPKAVAPPVNVNDIYDTSVAYVDPKGTEVRLAMPTHASNHRTCIFTITTDRVDGKNRFMGGGGSEWQGSDIPSLISRHEHAPPATSQANS